MVISMTTVHVKAGHGYEVLIGNGLIKELGTQVRRLLPKTQTVAVVSDDTVAALFLLPVMDVLAQAGLKPRPIVIPPGESSKTGIRYLSLLSRLATLTEKQWARLAESRLRFSLNSFLLTPWFF